MWKWVLIFALAGYAGVVTVLYVTQRSLQYFPENVRTSPAGDCSVSLPVRLTISPGGRASDATG